MSSSTISSAGPAEETAAEARELGVDALTVACDVANWGEVQRMVALVTERFGGVDILVNNASHFGKMTIPTDDIETWHRVTRISIDGPSLSPTRWCHRCWDVAAGR